MQLDSSIAQAVEQAIAKQQTPGAVVLVGMGDEVVLHQAFGHRMLAPQRLPMKLDTIFDMASLTKPLATATSVMQLVEEGSIVLSDPVSRYIPPFTGDGREHATIRHLLTHSAGLVPYKNYLTEFGDGVPAQERRQRAVQDICSLPLAHGVGEKFLYTCLGYILLASVVEVAGGRPLDEHAAERIYAPLGMQDTCFNPSEAARDRCAATEQLPDGALVGLVHDEDARFLNGVGGNAGLFSTAHDVSLFMRAFLNGGELEGARILSPVSVALMASPQSELPAGVRGLGWDVEGPYAHCLRGDLFATGTVGHSGYTGTSIWADMETRTYVVILTNRVHLGRDKSVQRLRSQIANIVAAGVLPKRRRFVYTPAEPARTGLDILGDGEFELLGGKRVGLVSNHTGIDSRRRHILDLLQQQQHVTVGAILSPEHGFAGKLDEKVASGTHDSGIPIHSLYGEHQAPTPEMLEGLDCLLYDIMDIGVRFYTYTTTMALCMKAAAQAGLEFILLDRPNPINGVTVAGPVLDKPFGTLAAWHPIALRHGMTSAELALWSNAEYGIDCDLQIVQCEGWRREQWFDETGLPWIDPSPNMRNLKQAILYPAIGALESANISVGRGTDTPFEVLGAPWIDGQRLAHRLNTSGIEELSFVPIEFTPTTREFTGERCEGVYMMLGDRARLQPVTVAVQIARLLREMWPETFAYQKIKHLTGSQNAVDMIGQLRPVEEIISSWSDELVAFGKKRQEYLIYG